VQRVRPFAPKLETMDKTNKKCIIFSAGDFDGLHDELHKVSSDDLIIAADAGYKNCHKSGFTPDIIIGDFDSMDEPSEPAKEIIRVPVEKDDTDTMLAIKLGLERDCTEFHLYGATGGTRLDHTIANLQGLAYLANKSARAYIYDNNYVYTSIKDSSITIRKSFDWAIISIFCMGKPAEGVQISGALYPLDNGSLDANFPLGVSNHFGESDSVSISVKEGTLLIAWELRK